MCFSKVTGFYLYFIYYFIYYPKKLNGWPKKPTLEHVLFWFFEKSQFFLDIFVLLLMTKKKKIPISGLEAGRKNPPPEQFHQAELQTICHN